jgi:hypothetical protein
MPYSLPHHLVKSQSMAANNTFKPTPLRGVSARLALRWRTSPATVQVGVIQTLDQAGRAWERSSQCGGY